MDKWRDTNHETTFMLAISLASSPVYLVFTGRGIVTCVQSAALRQDAIERTNNDE
jgi:hypothetical protein